MKTSKRSQRVCKNNREQGKSKKRLGIVPGVQCIARVRTPDRSLEKERPIPRCGFSCVVLSDVQLLCILVHYRTIRRVRFKHQQHGEVFTQDMLYHIEFVQKPPSLLRFGT